MAPFGFVLLFLLAAVHHGACDYIYDYFPLDHQKQEISAENLSMEYITPSAKLLPYRTIDEINVPEDLLRGRFHGFLRLLKVERSKLRATRRALANVIHYVQGGSFIRMLNSRPAIKSRKFRDVLLWWRYFYLCLSTYNFRTHYGPCTNGFVYRRENKFISTLDWDPERDIPLLPLKQDMLLILFNLGLCQHYHNHLHFLCPSTCLGRLKSGMLDENALPSENGNPCELQRNTRTAACESRRVWSVYIFQLFSDLVDPQTWDRLPGQNYLNWLTDEGGYVCDCAERHKWVDTALRCERISGWIDQCENNSTRLGPCDKDGTYQCITDQHSGAAYCECNPGYYGTRCKDKLDACKMKLVTYTYTNPETGKKVRKTASGNEMCNTNMSGIALPAPTEMEKSPDDVRSVCIPTLGTTGYRCKCKAPFHEDPTHPMPNCLKRAGPCDERLCIHGTCVSSSGQNGTSMCVCNPGYDGAMCEYKAEHWSVWSECLPICGFNRTRTRRRSTTIRDPSPWQPYFDDLAGIPNTMSDNEMRSYPGELIQAEVCPPRTGSQCPFSPSSPDYQLLASTDPGLLELQAVLSLAISVLLLVIGISACITRMARGHKF